MTPYAVADRISTVSLERLKAEGVRGIIIDLDNTTVGYGRDDVPEDVASWIADAKRQGFTLALVSNNFTGRVARVSRELGLMAISSALKPLPHGFLRASKMLAVSKGEIIVIGDQLFTDVLGARLAGMRAILTRPIEPRDWAGTRVLRLLERIVLGKR